MQDNALIHAAKSVTQQFKDRAIPILNGPPYSLDLNPIKHAQGHLKRKVLELHPKIEEMGTGEGFN